jgi:hypothetical protein
MNDYKILLINKRALSYKQLLDSTFPFKQYTNNINSGEYTGVLDMKSWGKSPCLHCYFTLSNNIKVRLTSYQIKNYSPKLSKIDMSSGVAKIGMNFKIIVSKSRFDKTKWDDIEII